MKGLSGFWKKTILWSAVALAVLFLALLIVFSVKLGNAGARSVEPMKLSDAGGETFWGINTEGDVVAVSEGQKRVLDLSEILGTESAAVSVAHTPGGTAVVCEDKNVYLLDENDQVAFTGRITGIPTRIAISEDGGLIACLMNSAISNSLAVFNIRENTYQRIALDCEGQKVLIEQKDGEYLLHVVKSDVQLVCFSAEGEELYILIIDDIPIDAVRVADTLYVLCEDSMLRVIRIDDYSLAMTSALPGNCNGIAAVPSVERLYFSNYNSVLWFSDLEGKNLSKVSAPYESNSILASESGALMLRTRTGETYSFGAESVEQCLSLKKLQTVFGILFALFAVVGISFGLTAFASSRARLRAFGRGIVKYRVPVLVLSPVVLLVGFLCYYPAVSGLVLSFLDYKPGAYSRFVGFQNFITMFQNAYFWTGFKNLLIFTSTGLVKAIIPPLFIALLILGVHSSRMQYFFRTALYLPAILPGVAGLMLWTNGIYGTSGLLNSILSALGREPVSWLGNKDTVVWMLVLIGFPWAGSFLIFYGGLKGVPNEYREAARVEGCSYLRMLFSLDLPLIMPQIRYVFVMSLIGCMQEFNLVYLTTGGGPGNASYVPMLEIYYQVRYQNYGVASAMGVFMFLLLLGLTLFNLRNTIRNKEDV